MQSRHTDLAGKRVLVVGLGRSGIAAARLCAIKGAQVTVNDIKTAAQLDRELPLLAPSIRVELGGHPPALFADQDIILLSLEVNQEECDGDTDTPAA